MVTKKIKKNSLSLMAFQHTVSDINAVLKYADEIKNKGFSTDIIDICNKWHLNGIRDTLNHFVINSNHSELVTFNLEQFGCKFSLK